MPRPANGSPQTLRVLEALLETPDVWQYGYDLSRRTGLKSGTLYPILIRLADQGWLATCWSEPEQAGRPPRHLYRLTSEGASRAGDAVATRTARRAVLRPGTGLAGG